MSDADTLTTGDVAAFCGVSRVTVWKWVKRGILPARRDAGGRYLVAREDLWRFGQERSLSLDAALFKRPRRVLVIDDEPAVVEVVTRALRQVGEGIQVATAEDGFEAGLQTATFRPDLLVLDLMMPRMDGFQVCRLIRRDPTTAHVKILVITAFGSRDNVQRAMAAGANDVILKPIEIHGFSRRVASLLDLGHEGEDAALP